MEFRNVDDLKKNVRGLDFLHINDGTDDTQEIIILNKFFLDNRNQKNQKNFSNIKADLNKFHRLCQRKMYDSLGDYQDSIECLLIDKQIDISNLESIVEQLEYFKKHIETRFENTLSAEELNRHYQIFQYTIFFVVNFFIKRTKEKIENIKLINEKKFEIFKTPSNYYKFENYIDVYLQKDNFYPEYSFLFRKLIENKIIEKLNHNNFADYLLKLDFINETQHALFLEKRSWLTQKKASTLDRESNYNKVFHLD